MKKCIHEDILYPKKSLSKLYRIMKFMFLLTFAGLVSLSANVYSQNKTLTLQTRNASLHELFKAIERQTEYRFFYNDELVNANKLVSIDVKDMQIDAVLDQLLADTDLQYKWLENNLIVVSSSSLLQQIHVTGLIIDSNDEPIPGANVIIKGTTTGVVTDAIGKFAINVPNVDAVLQISFVGFVTQEIRVGNQQIINVTLLEDARELEEVVVVGYGVQRKSDVTGSISVATSEDILASPTFNALTGLKGKAAGVNIFNNTGNPLGVSESAQRVVIRGMNSINTSTDPLYVVDGVQMNEIHYINPNDIERMEVLKDASATAIYGARGANGVILVTTKRGTSGAADGITVTYSGWVSLKTMARKIDLMNAAEFMEMQDIAFANFAKFPQSASKAGMIVDRSDPLIFDSNGNPLYDTDWQKEATRNAWSQSHQLNLQQQGKNSSIGAFLNYTDEQGLFINNYGKRINGRLTWDAKPLKWLEINSNIMVNHMWGNGVDDTGGGQVSRRTIWEMPPIFPVKFPDGRWADSQYTGSQLNFGLEAMTNPVHELKEIVRERYRSKVFGNFALVVQLADGLSLRTQVGVDANFRSNKSSTPNNMINISTRGNASIYNGQYLYWQEETYLNYNKLFDGIHRLNALVGLSWSENRKFGTNSSTINDFSNNYFKYYNLAAGRTPGAPTSEFQKWTMNSYFARASYSLMDKYLFTGTLRVDGSSRFGENNKYGFFPSVGLGWVMSKENFMQGTAAWLNNLKIHTSYGRTGNTEIDEYRSIALITDGTTLLNNGRQSTSELSRMANPDLTWEKTDQFDVGINLNMFKNRVNLELDYYNKQTNDILLEKPLPYTTGFSSIWYNMGRVDNTGIDFLLSTVNIEKENFTWESTLNLNYNKNEIKKLGDNDEDILTDPNFVQGQIILRVGEPMSSFYGYQRYGTFSTADAAADSKIIAGTAKRSDNREIIGNGMPKFTGSFINKFYYKNLDLIVDLQFVTGVDVWQLFFHSAEDRTGIANGLRTILYDGWTESNQNTMVQQIRQQNYSGQSSYSDSHWVCDGSYLRGSLLQLGYTFDRQLMQKWNIKTLRVNFSVNNAFLICSKDFKGFDPEGASNTNRNGQNVMFYQYPSSRIFSLGATLSF